MARSSELSMLSEGTWRDDSEDVAAAGVRSFLSTEDLVVAADTSTGAGFDFARNGAKATSVGRCFPLGTGSFSSIS